MKWFSISEFLSGFKSVLRRFPLSFIVTLIGFFCAFELAQFQDNGQHPILEKLLIICSLGLPLTLSIQLLVERYELTLLPKVLLNAVGISLLTAYFFYLPYNMENAPNFYFYRASLFWITLHLLVAFAPFIGSPDISSFWEFNKRLFLRMFLGALFSLTLFVGITLALLALDKLFGINIQDKHYFQAFIFCSGIVNTNFFLAGVPLIKKGKTLESDYPKGLRIFTSYILMPLVIIYLCILYTYMGKIIITHSWPRGWISYLVIYFSVAAILAALLVWPIRQNKERPWISLYSRWLFTLLIPLSIMLSISIYKRIHEYGITNDRYYIAVTAMWLFFISLYFIFKNFQNIKAIPISLFIILVVINVAPFNSFQLSRSNQLHRLTVLLQKNNILNNGAVVPSTEKRKISDSIAYKITTIVDYLCKDYGTPTLQPLFKTANLSDTGINKKHRFYSENGIDTIMAMMGMSPVYYLSDYDYDSVKTANKIASGTINYSVDQYLFNVTGYNYELDNPFYDIRIDTGQHINLGDTYHYHFNDSLMEFVMHSSTVHDTIKLSAVLDSVAQLHADTMNKDYKHRFDFYDGDPLTYTASSKTFRYKFILTKIEYDYSIITHKISGGVILEGKLLLNKRLYPDEDMKK